MAVFAWQVDVRVLKQAYRLLRLFLSDQPLLRNYIRARCDIALGQKQLLGQLASTGLGAWQPLI